MRGYVGTTDYDWFAFLRSRQPLDGVDFRAAVGARRPRLSSGARRSTLRLVGHAARKTSSPKRTTRARPKLVAIPGGKVKPKRSPRAKATKKELAAWKRSLVRFEREHGKLTPEERAAARQWLA